MTGGLPIGGMLWLTIFAAAALLFTRFVFGAWPWKGDGAGHDPRYYKGLVVLGAIGWLVVLVF